MSDALFAAITAGDGPPCGALVREDPALASARDGSGLPVVLLALFHQQREAADALLAAEPELGVLEAAATGRADRLRALLDAEPDALRERTPEGFTPLGLAAFLGGPEVVRVLLERRRRRGRRRRQPVRRPPGQRRRGGARPRDDAAPARGRGRSRTPASRAASRRSTRPPTPTTSRWRGCCSRTAPTRRSPPTTGATRPIAADDGSAGVAALLAG